MALPTKTFKRINLQGASFPPPPGPTSRASAGGAETHGDDVIYLTNGYMDTSPFVPDKNHFLNLSRTGGVSVYCFRLPS